MSEKNRVEIHDFKDWKAGVYLIEAGCGQGKNYFVFNTLFPYAHENGKRMLVFSNRVALREQQQAQTQEKDVKLITYQSLEHDEYLETMQDTKNKVRGLIAEVKRKITLIVGTTALCVVLLTGCGDNASTAESKDEGVDSVRMQQETAESIGTASQESTDSTATKEEKQRNAELEESARKFKSAENYQASGE